MKKCLTCFSLFIFFSMFFFVNVQASNTETFLPVSVTANIPSGFSEEIVISFSLNEQEDKSLLLNKENFYTGICFLESNKNYDIIIKEISSNYNLKSQNSIKPIDGENNGVNIEVIEITNFVSENENDTNYFLNDISDIQSADDVLSFYYENSLEFKKNEDYQLFFNTYTGSMFYNYFLDIDQNNTLEMWNNMSSFGKFNYYILYVLPIKKLLKYEYSSCDLFLKELEAQKNVLSNMENGDEFYKNIETVWEWIYSYWEITGTMYSFFSESNIDDEHIIIDEKTISSVLDNSTENKDITYKQDNNENIILSKKSEPVEARKNFFEVLLDKLSTIAILIILGISFVVFRIRLKNKNINYED